MLKSHFLGEIMRYDKAHELQYVSVTLFSKTQQFWSHSYWKTVSSEIEPEPASWTSVCLTFSNETIFSV